MSVFDLDYCRAGCGTPIDHAADYCENYPDCVIKSQSNSTTPNAAPSVEPAAQTQTCKCGHPRHEHDEGEAGVYCCMHRFSANLFCNCNEFQAEPAAEVRMDAIEEAYRKFSEGWHDLPMCEDSFKAGWQAARASGMGDMKMANGNRCNCGSITRVHLDYECALKRSNPSKYPDGWASPAKAQLISKDASSSGQDQKVSDPKAVDIHITDMAGDALGVDATEELRQAMRLISEFDFSEGDPDRRNRAIDALYHWRNITDKLLASTHTPEQPSSDYCEFCREPVTGSVHLEMVSGKKRCFRCNDKLRKSQDSVGNGTACQNSAPPKEK